MSNHWDRLLDPSIADLPVLRNPPVVVMGEPKKPLYFDLMSLYFVGLAVSFPLQVLYLQDRMGTLQDWMEMPQNLTVLNWLCIMTYATSALALQKGWPRLWAFLSASFLVTAINNTFVAFAALDYSMAQSLLGTLAFTVPLLPLAAVESWRAQILDQTKINLSNSAPRFKKRWRVEILSAGQVVPGTGITLNISSSGALVHWLTKSHDKNLFDLRLSEPQGSVILDCKARRVRDAEMVSGSQVIPVMGLEFMGLSPMEQEDLNFHLSN